MKARETLEAFIKVQLDNPDEAKEKFIRGKRGYTDAHHYGRCELVDLLDFIYNETTPPKGAIGRLREGKL